LPLEARLLAGLGLSVLLVYILTPVAIRVAGRLDFYDKPAGYKKHGAPTPYLGGAAVVAGFAAVVLLLTGDWARTAPLVGGVAVLWLVGTIDDRRTLKPGLRAAIEVALAGGLWALGLGWELGLGAAVDFAVTAFWLVAVINAFNFFDNMDGATSSMAAVVAAGIAVLGVTSGDAWLAVVAVALSGACLGFLPHNLLAAPARIFLGDGGSMPVGFAVASLVMIGTTGAAAGWQALALGVLLVGVPALDTTLVIVSRLRQGIPILTGGRDHVTHRTRQLVRTARAVALTLGGAQAAISAGALVAIAAGPGTVAGVVALYVAAAGAALVFFDTRLRPPAPALSRARADARVVSSPSRRTAVQGAGLSAS
jgi:UDP-GlcNAc:undecaprenyl-phosphate GlcNAc-1-phosphate transferase